jgi:hypothetical protein
MTLCTQLSADRRLGRAGQDKRHHPAKGQKISHHNPSCDSTRLEGEYIIERAIVVTLSPSFPAGSSIADWLAARD